MNAGPVDRFLDQLLFDAGSEQVAQAADLVLFFLADFDCPMSTTIVRDDS